MLSLEKEWEREQLLREQLDRVEKERRKHRNIAGGNVSKEEN